MTAPSPHLAPEQGQLLGIGEPPPAMIERDAGASPFVLICDHAGRRLPNVLGDLGVSEAELERHIAWDIGAAGLAREMARRLDAFLVTQTYSRLVIDCNRPPVRLAPSSPKAKAPPFPATAS